MSARRLLVVAVAVFPLLASLAGAAAGDTTLVSRSSGGTIGNGRSDLSSTASASGHGTVSADGRYVAFESAASNLVEGDTNSLRDVFVHDRQTGETRRVSVASDGTQGDGSSRAPSISADGRFVAFDSDAKNLAGTDTGLADVFVHDLETGVTERITAPNPVHGSRFSRFPAISGDGRYVAFESDALDFVEGDTNGAIDVFVYDRELGVMERVSVAGDATQANGHSVEAAISPDGRYVAFKSGATNLDPADTTATLDVFVRDRQAGTTELVSVGAAGGSGNGASEHPALSADGRFVAFESNATNLTDSDANGSQDDVYLRDRSGGTTERISVKSDGTQASGTSHRPSVSGDGNLVVFTSTAQLAAGDTGSSNDAYLRDRSSGTTRQVNVKSDGTPDNGDSLNVAVSSNGTLAAFDSNASDLAAGDANGTFDVFAHELGSAEPPPADGACILVEPSTAVDFGTAMFSTSDGVESKVGVPDVGVTNCGTASADVVVRATAATGTSATWNLDDAAANPCDAGTNVFGLLLGTLRLATADKPWATLAADEKKTETASILMPCTGSAGTGETLTTQIVFTATSP